MVMAKNVEEYDHLKGLSHFKCIAITATSFSKYLASDDSDEDDDDYATSSSSSDTRPHQGETGTVQPKHETKKGLSRYYEGKSRTFESLSDAKCVQDLAKKEILFLRRGPKKSISHERITC